MRRWRANIRVEGSSYNFFSSFSIIFEKKLFDLDLCKFKTKRTICARMFIFGSFSFVFMLSLFVQRHTAYSYIFFLSAEVFFSTFEIWIWLVSGLFFFSLYISDNNFWIRFNTNLNRKIKESNEKGFEKCYAYIKEIFFPSQLPFRQYEFFFASVFSLFVWRSVFFFSVFFWRLNKIQYSNLCVIFYKCAHSIESNRSHSNRKLIHLCFFVLFNFFLFDVRLYITWQLRFFFLSRQQCRYKLTIIIVTCLFVRQ